MDIRFGSEKNVIHTTYIFCNLYATQDTIPMTDTTPPSPPSKHTQPFTPPIPNNHTTQRQPRQPKRGQRIDPKRGLHR